MRRHYYKQTRSRQFFRSPSQFTRAMPLGWVGESAYNDQPQFPERQARAKEIYKMSMLKNTTVVCILNFPVFVLDSCGTCYFGLSSWEKLQLTIQKLSRQAERIDSGSPHNPLKYNFGCNMISPQDGVIVEYGSHEMVVQLRRFIYFNFFVNNLFSSLIDKNNRGESDLGRQITEDELGFVTRCVNVYFKITHVVQSATPVRTAFGFSSPAENDIKEFLNDFLNVAQFFPAASVMDIRKCLGNYKTGTVPISSSSNMLVRQRTEPAQTGDTNLTIIENTRILTGGE